MLTFLTPSVFRKRYPLLHYGFHESHIAPLLLIAHREGLCGLYLYPKGQEEAILKVAADDFRVKLSLSPDITFPFFQAIQKGEPIPCILQGTPFQQEVWKALAAIPTQTVTTYGALAKAIQRPTSYRAVANAVGSNPISWAIPCHRVIRKDGMLGGYRWGLDFKKALLAHEGITLVEL